MQNWRDVTARGVIRVTALVGSSEEGRDLPCFDVSVLEKGSAVAYTAPSFPGGQPRRNIYLCLMAA